MCPISGSTVHARRWHRVLRSAAVWSRAARQTACLRQLPRISARRAAVPFSAGLRRAAHTNRTMDDYCGRRGYSRQCAGAERRGAVRCARDTCPVRQNGRNGRQGRGQHGCGDGTRRCEFRPIHFRRAERCVLHKICCYQNHSLVFPLERTETENRQSHLIPYLTSSGILSAQMFFLSKHRR